MGEIHCSTINPEPELVRGEGDNCMDDSELSVRAGIKNVSSAEPSPVKWFVMRDLKRPNALCPAYKSLREDGFEVFTPMVERIAVRRGKRVKEQVPVIRDLLFVHSPKEALDDALAQTNTLQFRYVRGGYRRPMVVGDAEMNAFMAAVNAGAKVEYYAPGELTAAMLGRQVRIIGGPLDGQVGALKTRRGSRTRPFVVELQGLLAVAVDVTGFEYLEVQ